ncbi:MAG: HIT family protein [Pseudomonadota bacterium]
MNNFQIHAQLIQDCHVLGKMKSSHLLLNKNAVLPWFILVPETDQQDLLDLEEALRTQVIQDAATISQFVKQHFNLQKINFAAIGNLVPQLHIHVVGRYEGDACWPHPVWGNLKETQDWPEATLTELKQALF